MKPDRSRYLKYLTKEDKELLKKECSIKPCPFCGHLFPQLLESDETCWISCSDAECEADGPVKSNVESAEYFWNRREA